MQTQRQNTSITPFSTEGDLFLPQQTQEQESLRQEPEENNRKRHFRALANYCELASGATINATICFTFRALGVSAPGYVVALVVTHAYFTATAASDQRRAINHILTGLASGVSTIATLAEPLGNVIESTSATNEFYSDLNALEPKQNDGVTGLLILAFALVTLCFGFSLIKGKGGRR